MRKHYDGSTGAAYDRSRWDEQISFGDLLIVDEEHVVGIAHEFPVAVTRERGEFHACVAGYALKLFGAETVFAAIREARVRGYELDGQFAKFAN